LDYENTHLSEIISKIAKDKCGIIVFGAPTGKKCNHV